MSDIVTTLRERLAAVPTIVDVEVTAEALDWLCGDERPELTSEARAELVERGYLDETGELTEAGAWARRVVGRDDRQSIIVRTQRGSEFRTLELHHDDGVLFVVDVRAHRDEPVATYRVGYSAFADVSNLITRWLNLVPFAENDDLDYVAPLDEVMESVKNDDSSTTLVSIIVDGEPTFDLLFADDIGYFGLDVTVGESDNVAETLAAVEGMPNATLTSISALDVYLLLVDAFSTPAGADAL